MSKSEIETYLDEIDPYEFETLVADIWEESGWETSVTSGSQDRGIDVMAEKEDPIYQRVLIQAKAYGQSNKIGSEEVRKYATLYQQESDADRVVIVTTGWFTSQAKQLADDLNVNLIDRSEILEMINSSEVDINHMDINNQSKLDKPPTSHEPLNRIHREINNDSKANRYATLYTLLWQIKRGIFIGIIVFAIVLIAYIIIVLLRLAVISESLGKLLLKFVGISILVIFPSLLLYDIKYNWPDEMHPHNSDHRR